MDTSRDVYLVGSSVRASGIPVMAGTLSPQSVKAGSAALDQLCHYGRSADARLRVHGSESSARFGDCLAFHSTETDEGRVCKKGRCDKA